MINKPHRIVEPVEATKIIHQSSDGVVTEKKQRKHNEFKKVFDQKMRKYQ